MMLFDKEKIISFLSLYDAKEVAVEIVSNGENSYVNIYHSNGNKWYSLKYCAFENEKEANKKGYEVAEILSDYYDDNLKVLEHSI